MLWLLLTSTLLPYVLLASKILILYVIFVVVNYKKPYLNLLCLFHFKDRHVEKESLSEYIAKKREMFLVQVLLFKFFLTQVSFYKFNIIFKTLSLIIEELYFTTIIKHFVVHLNF